MIEFEDVEHSLYKSVEEGLKICVCMLKVIGENMVKGIDFFQLNTSICTS